MAKVYLKIDRRETVSGNNRFDVSAWFSHKGKTASKRLGILTTPEEWAVMENEILNFPESSMRPQSRILFKKLMAMRAKVDEIKYEKDINELSATELRDIVIARIQGLPDPLSKKNSFLAFYDDFTDKKETEGTRTVYKNTRSRVLAFDDNAQNLALTDITPEWLERFDDFLAKTQKTNSRNHHMRNIRAVINHAHKIGLISSYPFNTYKMPRVEQTRKRALTAEEIKTLRDWPCEGFEREYRDLFLLSFYLIGMNAVDLLTAKRSDVKNGRLEYRRAKTHRLYSIKIEPEAQEIVERYAGKEYLLAPMERYNSTRDYLHHWNDGLKRIGTTQEAGKKRTGTALFSELSTYWARHSWATMASRLDISLEVIGRALGHTWTMGGITNVYIDFDEKKIDEANRKVLDNLK